MYILWPLSRCGRYLAKTSTLSGSRLRTVLSTNAYSSSRFLLHYDRTQWPYHNWYGISMDVAKSGRRGYSCLGIVTPAFMIEDIRSQTKPVALMHRLVVYSVRHWFLYTPFTTFQAYPHRPGCIHGIGEGRQDTVGYRRPSRRRGDGLYWIGQTIRKQFCNFFTAEVIA